jgi:hypothetical protein
VKKIFDFILTNGYGFSLERRDALKYKNVTLFFAVAGLFLGFLPHNAVTASAGTTAILTFSYIPATGG